MKSKSLLILIIAALFVIGCTVSYESAAKRSDPQTVRDETLVSGTHYSLQDLEGMDTEDMDRAFFTNEPVISNQIKQTAKSKVPSYSIKDLENMDREDMDRVFFTNEPVISNQIRQAANSKIFPVSTKEPAEKQTVVSGTHYSLQDLEDMDREEMDRAFFTNEPNLCPKKLTAK